MHSAQHSRELMVQDRLKDKEMYLKHLKTIFTAIGSAEGHDGLTSVLIELVGEEYSEEH